MKFLLFLVFVLPLTATADQTVTFDWDATSDTVLYVYGNATASIETTDSLVYSGTQSLKFVENPLGGTPQACVAWIRNLTDGDMVTASFWVYDITPGDNPSGRIWGHWNDSADPDSVEVYSGSAGGNSEYSAGTGWSQLEYTWTVADGHTGLIIEGRIYSGEVDDTVWFDDLSITAPDNATFILPGGEVALVRNTWGSIKSSF